MNEKIETIILAHSKLLHYIVFDHVGSEFILVKDNFRHENSNVVAVKSV